MISYDTASGVQRKPAFAAAYKGQRCSESREKDASRISTVGADRSSLMLILDGSGSAAWSLRASIMLMLSESSELRPKNAAGFPFNYKAHCEDGVKGMHAFLSKLFPIDAGVIADENPEWVYRYRLASWTRCLTTPITQHLPL